MASSTFSLPTSRLITSACVSAKAGASQKSSAPSIACNQFGAHPLGTAGACSPFALSAPPLRKLEVQTRRKLFPVFAAAVASGEGTAALSAMELSTLPPVFINGAAGKMGQEVAKAALAAGVPLVPLGLTGPGLPREKFSYSDSAHLEVFPAAERDAVLDQALAKFPNLIVVDYTLPFAVNGNAEWYCRRGVPFVMGTTGGDRALLMKTVEDAGIYAVIAAQMGKQVVAFIAAMESLAQQSPGAFAGYKLKVVESHQSTKVDTSGTAKDVVSALQRLGARFEPNDEIEKVRVAEEQKSRMGVPDEFLNAHAFHTYSLTSPDNTVSFQFQHNVCGRSIYAQGAIDAVLLLHQKIAEGAEKKIYNMIDVLKGGSMR